MIEKTQRLNVKDLQWKEPVAPKRLRPAVDFSKEPAFARELVGYIPDLPVEFRNAVVYLDNLGTIFGDKEQIDLLYRKDRTWRDYISEEFMSQDLDSTAMMLLFHEAVQDARNENRNPGKDELSMVTTALTDLASFREGQYADGLREIANYPEFLLWMAEVIEFQESTLSIPDYSTPEFRSTETENMPAFRKF